MAQMPRIQLNWPDWLAQQVADAARAKAVSRAAWVRMAAIEKLEREGAQQAGGRRDPA